MSIEWWMTCGRPDFLLDDAVLVRDIRDGTVSIHSTGWIELQLVPYSLLSMFGPFLLVALA